jgi:calcineurin-like phosphoesterase family protein
MSDVYVISDTHFFDDGIIATAGRPFKSVDEMNEALIKDINAWVGYDDILFHLGDVGCEAMGENTQDIQDLISQINCKNKILILGNHDRKWSTQTWRNIGFQEVSKWPIIYEDWYVLTHEPLYTEVNSPMGIIYGHLHQHFYSQANKRYFNACVDVNGYSPVPLKQIKSIMKGE